MSDLGVGPRPDFPTWTTVAGGSIILIPSETSSAEFTWMLTQTGLQEPQCCADYWGWGMAYR